MAYVSRLPQYSRGGVAVIDIQEGRAVTFTQSGARNDLPNVQFATANAVKNVFVAIVPPDQFARPTLEGMYTAGRLTQLPSPDKITNWQLPMESGVYYLKGKSVFENPTLKSGELVALMRGVTVAVPSGAYVDSTDIKVPGSLVKVGASGMWETTTTESQAVGVVEEFNTTNSHLIFTVWD